MATPRSQRIGIWVIAIVMAIGTIGSFAAIMLSTQNTAQDDARLQELLTAYQNEYAEYEKKVDAQSDELSKKYYDTFKKYESRVKAFNKGSVEALKTEDLKAGTGEKIDAESSFSAYYIGWNPDGKIFDSSFDGKKLSTPYFVTPGSVIEGWTQGLVGMKVGGIRELTIPSDLAYGEMGQGEDIGPNTPLKFIVMIIPTPDPVEGEPQPSDELLRLYNQQNQ